MKDYSKAIKRKMNAEMIKKEKWKNKVVSDKERLKLISLYTSLSHQLSYYEYRNELKRVKDLLNGCKIIDGSDISKFYENEDDLPY